MERINLSQTDGEIALAEAVFVNGLVRKGMGLESNALFVAGISLPEITAEKGEVLSLEAEKIVASIKKKRFQVLSLHQLV